MPSSSSLTAIGLIVLLAAAAGCGDDESRSTGLTPSGPSTTSSSTGGSGGSGGVGGDGGMGGTAGSGGESELGRIAVAEVADTPCVSTTAAPVELYPNDAFAPVFARVEQVGSRWVAGHGAGIEGFVTFDADGSNASTPPVSMGGGNRFASEGATFGMTALSGANAVYQRYDDQGQAVGGQLMLGAGDLIVNPEVAGGAGDALVVWARAGALYGRGIDSGGALAGPEFVIALNAYATSVRIAIARHASGYAVAYTGDATGSYRTSFVLASLTQLEGAPVEVVNTSEAHRLLRLVPTTGGFALLLTGPFPEAAPFVVPLDPQGGASTAYKLLGAVLGRDLAAQGSELGVLAARPSGEPEFRPFDAAMSPLGPWVCLDAVGDAADDGALYTDGAGYAAIYRRPQSPVPQGKEIFMRFNNLGTAP